MHCVSNYPLNPINSNIGYIERLKKIFPLNIIGYSSHESNIYNCVIALSKNIDYIERHFTIDKNAKGLDHTSSSDFDEMRDLCFYAKNYRIISQISHTKNINQGEKINIQNLGKSAVSSQKILKGQKINLKKIYYTAPKIGLSNFDLKKFVNIKLKKDLHPNNPITRDYFIKKKNLDIKSNFFLNNKKISIPVRPHDFIKMDNIFKIKNYEFHLSFNDVQKFNLNEIKKNSSLLNKFFSVHGPDYCSETDVLDIFSNNPQIQKKSKKLLFKTLNICKSIQKITNNQIYLIQSFSSLNEQVDKYKMYSKINNFVRQIKLKYNISILPQWLPPIAWYFGGSVKMHLFSNPDDLNFLKKIKLNICMDLSHFLMSCNFFGSNFAKLLNGHLNLFSHYHLSDAQGFDSEGLPLGEGDLLIKYRKTIKKIINNDKIKVLETWQGHLNDGLIFKNEINKIVKL